MHPSPTNRQSIRAQTLQPGSVSRKEDEGENTLGLAPDQVLRARHRPLSAHRTIHGRGALIERHERHRGLIHHRGAYRLPRAPTRRAAGRHVRVVSGGELRLLPVLSRVGITTRILRVPVGRESGRLLPLAGVLSLNGGYAARRWELVACSSCAAAGVLRLDGRRSLSWSRLEGRRGLSWSRLVGGFCGVLRLNERRGLRRRRLVGHSSVRANVLCLYGRRTVILNVIMLDIGEGWHIRLIRGR
jgi:hypothetical protein